MSEERMNNLRHRAQSAEHARAVMADERNSALARAESAEAEVRHMECEVLTLEKRDEKNVAQRGRLKSRLLTVEAERDGARLSRDHHREFTREFLAELDVDAYVKAHKDGLGGKSVREWCRHILAERTAHAEAERDALRERVAELEEWCAPFRDSAGNYRAALTAEAQDGE